MSADLDCSRSYDSDCVAVTSDLSRDSASMENREPQTQLIIVQLHSLSRLELHFRHVIERVLSDRSSRGDSNPQACIGLGIALTFSFADSATFLAFSVKRPFIAPNSRRSRHGATSKWRTSRSRASPDALSPDRARAAASTPSCSEQTQPRYAPNPQILR